MVTERVGMGTHSSHQDRQKTSVATHRKPPLQATTTYVFMPSSSFFNKIIVINFLSYI
jgi:hypothetical protein